MPMPKKASNKKTDAEHAVRITADAIAHTLGDAGIDNETASKEARKLVERLLEEKNRVKDPAELAYDWLRANNVHNSNDARMCVIGIIEHTPTLFVEGAGQYDLPFAMFSFSRFRVALRRAKFSNDACDMFNEMLEIFQYTASMYVDNNTESRNSNKNLRLNVLSERDLNTVLVNTDTYAPDVELPRFMRKQFNDMMVTHMRRNFANTLVMFAPEYIADAGKRKRVESTYRFKFEQSSILAAESAMRAGPAHTAQAMKEEARKLSNNQHV